MTQSFEDRVEEVLGELHGMAWPLLEEPQKKKIIAKVAKGIEKGDTYAAWGRALGCDRQTIANRIEHYRRSEDIDGVRARTENEEKRIRHAKAVLKDERLVDQMLEDRTTALALAKAAARHQNKIEAEVNAENKRRSPGLVHRMGFNEVAGDLLRVRSLLAKTLDGAKELDLEEDEASALEQDLKEIDALVDWFRSFLKSGNSDFDTELARILEG